MLQRPQNRVGSLRAHAQHLDRHLTWILRRNHGRSSTFRPSCMCRGKEIEWECKSRKYFVWWQWEQSILSNILPLRLFAKANSLICYHHLMLLSLTRAFGAATTYHPSAPLRPCVVWWIARTFACCNDRKSSSVIMCIGKHAQHLDKYKPGLSVVIAVAVVRFGGFACATGKRSNENIQRQKVCCDEKN